MLLLSGTALAQKESGTVQRIGGSDRFATSAALSALAFGRADTVVLTVADAPIVAAMAAPLAATLDGPVLLTATDRLTDDAAGELARLEATSVVLVALTEEVSPALRAGVDNLDIDVDLLLSATLDDLALGIAGRMGPAPVVYLTDDVSVEAWQGAARLAPWATRDAAPILPYTDGGIGPDVVEFLRDQRTERAVFLDDQEHLMTPLPGQLRSLGIELDRVAIDRPPASYAACDRGTLGLGSSLSYPDLASAAPLLAQECATLALVNPEQPEQLLDDIYAVGEDLQADRLLVFGGLSTLSDGLVTRVASEFGVRQPVSKGLAWARSSGGDVLALLLALVVFLLPAARRRDRSEHGDDEQDSNPGRDEDQAPHQRR
ncbi:cell wall-binding repeat-containing protein [Euzebya tangerina]|uniref:cell wall-binding repeat-containing protein n=1 Tax=Euzebya tangerina TaxID=591198 RepID=UPI0013C3792D|nr:cell wall-binding repeat-containing protein [Euzebya tangerina]